jgi:hypothetical protein
MEGCGHTLCSYIILEPLLCTTSPWSMTCVLWSGALHLCWPTSAHCRLLVRAWPTLYCWPPLPLIYIEEGESPSFIIIIVSLLFVLVFLE